MSQFRFKNSVSEQVICCYKFDWHQLCKPALLGDDLTPTCKPAPWHKMKQNRGAGLFRSACIYHFRDSTKTITQSSPYACRSFLSSEKAHPLSFWEKMCFLCLCMRLSLEERFVLSGQFSQLYDVRLQGCNFLFHDFILLPLQGQFPALCSP